MILPSRKTSVTVVVIIALVTLTTLVLGTLGVINYRNARNRELENVRMALTLDADQIAPSLELPIWNFDSPEIDKVAESMMLDRIIEGLVVKSADGKTVICARERDADGKIREMIEDFSATGFLVEKRDVTYDGKTLATITLFGTTAAVDVKMKGILVWTVSNILALDLILIFALYLLLRRWVFKPLQEVEAYAATVSTGGGEGSPNMNSRFWGELENLRASLEKMFGLLNARYAESRASEEKFSKAFQSNPIGIAITDMETGLLTEVNESCARLFGYTPEEMVGRSTLELGIWEKEEDRNLMFQLLQDRGALREFEARTKTRDGGTKIVVINAEYIEFGGKRRVLTMSDDITERKRVEEKIRTLNADLERRVQARTAELSIANTRLEQASRHKDEFLANMSHELRTPLNAILGLSEALIEQVTGTLTPRQVKSLSTISTSGQHLLALINDILDLSKVEAGKLDLHPELISVEEFCQSCLAFVRAQALQKRIGVAFEYDGRATNLRADPRRFKQVLVNLLTNAVKFTPEGGRIGLTVTVPEGGDVVRFTVWDTGIGIAPVDAARLFRAFTQVDSGLNRAQEGTGLGLALVAKLVELHHGRIALESEPGKGSRFIVTLPMGEPEVPLTAAGESPVRRELHSKDSA